MVWGLFVNEQVATNVPLCFNELLKDRLQNWKHETQKKETDGDGRFSFKVSSIFCVKM